MKKKTSTNTSLENSKWGKMAPWLISITSLVVLYIIGNFLITNIEWYTNTVFDSKELILSETQAPVYRIHAYHMHLSMIKRSVGLFSGFAIMFLGLGVAFFSLKKNTELELKSADISTKLVTVSPGIFAMLIGSIVLMYTIGSKDEFSPFPVIYESAPIVKDSTLNKNNINVVVFDTSKYNY